MFSSYFVNMDSIDKFLELLDLKTEIDVFCSFRSPYLMQAPQAEKGKACFHLLLSGHCQMRSDKSVHRLQAGDFCLWTQGSMHQIGDAAEYSSVQVEQQNGILYRHNCQQDPSLQMICGHYRAGNQAAAGLLSLLPEPLIVSLKQIPQLSALSSLIYQEALARHLGSATVIKSMCEILLLFALRHLSSLSEQQSLIRLFSDPALSKAITPIFHNLADNYTIEQLAQKAYMSRATFARRFQQLSGMGVQAFVRLLRMSMAAKLLRQTNLSSSQIMAQIGYQSEAAFFDAFKAQFGTTPSRYRKNLLTNG